MNALDVMHREGIVEPSIVLAEAARTGLPLALACALLEQESGGGRNVFGHDPTIFVGAGAVTHAKYLAYRTARRASGNRRMQGAGPCQLTWWETQDEADRDGGCWRTEVNMRVGFRKLAALINAYGPPEGIRRYNGSGPAAIAYSLSVRRRHERWRGLLYGADLSELTQTREDRWQGSLERRRAALRRVLELRRGLRSAEQIDSPAYATSTAQMRGLRKTIALLDRLLRRPR